MDNLYGGILDNSAVHLGKTYVLREAIIAKKGREFLFTKGGYFIMLSHMPEEELPRWDGDRFDSWYKAKNKHNTNFYKQTADWYEKYTIKKGYRLIHNELDIQSFLPMKTPLVTGVPPKPTAQSPRWGEYSHGFGHSATYFDFFNINMCVSPYRKNAKRLEQIAKKRGIEIDTNFYDDELLVFTRILNTSRSKFNIYNPKGACGLHISQFRKGETCPNQGLYIQMKRDESELDIEIQIYSPINSYDLIDDDYGFEIYGRGLNKKRTIQYSASEFTLSSVYNVDAPEATAVPTQLLTEHKNKTGRDLLHGGIDSKLFVSNDPWWCNYTNQYDRVLLEEPYLHYADVGAEYINVAVEHGSTPWVWLECGRVACETGEDVRERITNFAKSKNPVGWSTSVFCLLQHVGVTKPNVLEVDWYQNNGYLRYFEEDGICYSIYATAYKNGVCALIGGWEELRSFDTVTKQTPFSYKKQVSPQVTVAFLVSIYENGIT